MPTAVNQKNALDTQLVFCAIGEVSYHKINCFRECTKLQTNQGRRSEFQLMGERCLMSHWEFQLMLQITFQPCFQRKLIGAIRPLQKSMGAIAPIEPTLSTPL